MSKPQMDKIGQGRAYPDPQMAIVAETGVYHDAASEGGLAEKLPTTSFPMVGCASTLNVKSRAGGSR